MGGASFLGVGAPFPAGKAFSWVQGKTFVCKASMLVSVEKTDSAYNPAPVYSGTDT